MKTAHDDALYCALAKVLKAELATLDTRLAEALAEMGEYGVKYFTGD